jgi:hypothetical protein
LKGRNFKDPSSKKTMKREREKEGKREGTLGSLWKKNNKKTRAV